MAEASKPRPEEPSKAERLAAALRQNLKRRKAQARAQQDSRESPAKEADQDKAPSR